MHMIRWDEEMEWWFNATLATIKSIGVVDRIVESGKDEITIHYKDLPPIMAYVPGARTRQDVRPVVLRLRHSIRN